MQSASVGVVFVHHLWMATFIYGWLFLLQSKVQSCLYVNVIFSTLVAWKLWDGCPVTELENALAAYQGEGVHAFLSVWWTQTYAFVYMLVTMVIIAILVVQKIKKLNKTIASVKNFLYARGMELGAVLLFLGVIVNMFRPLSGHTIAAMLIGGAVVIASLSLKITQQAQAHP